MTLFSDIIGHEEQTELLQSLIKKNRLPHALMLWGGKGIGKKKVGLALAKFLLSQHLPVEKQNLVSLRVDNGNHPDFWFIEKARDKRNILADQIDEMQKKSYVKSESENSVKVFLIDGPESFNETAANGFLKLLEEPPESVFFILISHDKGSVLPTIASRCQHYFLSALSKDQVELVLERESNKEQDLDIESKAFLSCVSMGSPGNAMQMHAKGVLFLKNKIENALLNKPKVKPYELRAIFEDYLELESTSTPELEGLNQSEINREKIVFAFELLQIFLRELAYRRENTQNDCNLWYNNSLENISIESKVFLHIMDDITIYIKSVKENCNVALALDAFSLDMTNTWNTN